MSVINTNVKSLAAQESMRSSNLSMSQAMERLSTGKKINSAKDDAAGLAITNRMTSQIRGIAKAIGNVNDAISMTQTAEGALGNVSDILQRMRELSVQSANGTNNDADRASLQLEVSQLKDQIQKIATSTNHNNIKLLDGSAQNITIQNGAGSDDKMKIDFSSMQTKDIGVGSKATVTSTGGVYAAGTNAALTAGSLFLNGVAVGASLATDDMASYSQAASSAIAKAAAINKVSALSGVYAKAGATVFGGGIAMTSGSTAASGTLTINGVETDTFATSTDNSITRKAIVVAVNAKSGETGVVATDTGDDNLGVSFTAADGRNIVIARTTITSAATGIVAGTYVGSYNLYTLDGRDINVSFVDGTQDSEAMSGLRNGTYKSDQALMTTSIRASAALGTAPSDTTTGTLQSNSLIINGVAIGQAVSTDDTATDTTATSSTRASSAIAIAAAINRSASQTGVTASAAPNVLRGQGFTAANSAITLYLNGQSIGINQGSRNGVIDQINQYSNLTGVVASAWGTGIQYTAADGRNISIATTSAASAQIGLTNITVGGATTSAAGTSAVTFISQVTLKSDNAFTIKAGSHGIANLELLGMRQGTFGAADNGLKINQLDISTVAGASQAMVAIDAAMATVNTAQSKAGAVGNRLDSVISNLSEMNQNMQASRSRILDTDYAIETTNLAKQQIIQQAATAMLAQANQSSQGILSLLK